MSKFEKKAFITCWYGILKFQNCIVDKYFREYYTDYLLYVDKKDNDDEPVLSNKSHKAKWFSPWHYDLWFIEGKTKKKFD